MSKQMTVSKRIVLGFSVVILIAVALGGLGVWSMRTAKTNSDKLATEYVPEVRVANDLRAASNRVMYQMRGYGLAEDSKYYEAAQLEMAALNKHLGEAEDLAARAIYLKALKGQTQTARNAKTVYEGLMKETEATVTTMAALRTQLDQNAATYMGNCADFLAGQNTAFKRDLEERQTKVELVTKIVNVGTQVRVKNFKGQATNDMSLLREAEDLLKGLGQYTRELRPITHDAEDIERIDNTEAAADEYGDVLAAYIHTHEALEADGEEMNASAAAYMSNCAAFLAGQNEQMRREFKEAGANLEERLQKITLVNKIIDVGNAVRVANFKAQAHQDAKLMHEAIDILKGVTKITAELRKITRDSVDLTRIDDTETAARAYQAAMDDYLENYTKIHTERLAMDHAAGQYVTNCAAFLAGQQEKLARDMHERHDKISLVNDIIDLGNDARIKAFKSQALRSPSIMQAALNNFPLLDTKYAALRKITRLDIDLKRITDTKASGDHYAQVLTSFLGEWTTLQSLGQQREAAGQQVIDACKATAEAGMIQTNKIATDAAASLASSSMVMIIGLSIGTIISIFAALWITRSITGPLKRIIAGLTEGGDQIASASGQVSSASQSLAEGATEQAASLEETSSSLEEMSSMTKQNAESAQQASSLASEARTAADTGAEAMGRMNTAISDIQKSSEETSKIIKVIDEIAFQTNLLALNAAVEAARAGEAGKGFAVVAEEVRNLAMRSAEAAKNTSSMIEESVKNSNNGVDIAGEVAKVLDEIVQGIGKTTDLVGEIAAASQEQAQGIDQIKTAVTQMDEVTQQNAANAEESASASGELSAQAEQMNQIVGELIAMVGGEAKRSPSNTMSHSPRVAGHTRRLSTADNAFHQIAGSPEKRAKSKVAVAAGAIPLAEDPIRDLDGFND